MSKPLSLMYNVASHKFFGAELASQDCSSQSAVLDEQYPNGVLTSSATSVKAAISLLTAVHLQLQYTQLQPTKTTTY